MLKNKTFVIVMFFLLMGSVVQLHAQKFSKSDGSNLNPKGWIINLSGGTTVFFGDVKQNPFLPVLSNQNELLYGGALSIERVFNPLFSLRGQAMYSQLSGTNRDTDVYFLADMLEANLSLLYYPINSIMGYDPNRLTNLYILAGIGANNYNTTLYALSNGFPLRRSGYGNGVGIDGRTFESYLVGGIGVDFLLSSKWQIRLETANHIMGSDNLDITKGGFAYDMYNVTTLGIQFKIGSEGRKKKSKIPNSSPNVTPKDEAEPIVKDWQSFNEVVDLKLIDTLEVEKIIVPVDTVLFSNEKIEDIVQPIPKEIKPELEYRVQIFAAGKNPIDRKILATRHKLDVEDIQEDYYNGMYIYSVGNYMTYEEASTNKVKVRSQNGVSDAFVVAFKNGKRLQQLPK